MRAPGRPDVDASDKWFNHAFDERWRWVATFREDDSDPKEEFLHHAAGLDGRGTGSYMDLVILRDRDINSGWTCAFKRTQTGPGGAESWGRISRTR
jgi:hypothetical protein